MNTKWAEKNFLAWVEQHATSVPGDPVPADLLKSSNQPDICKYLQCFVLETRRGWRAISSCIVAKLT